MRDRDTRTDYTFGPGEGRTAAQDRKRRRRLAALAVLTAIGAADAFGYRHVEPRFTTFQPLAPLVNPSSKTTRVYRWKDANGNWQVADRHPGEDVVYEVLEYRNDVNVLPLPPELRDQE